MDGREGHDIDEDGADGIEEDLEGTEEGLSEEGVEEESLKAGGEISIQAIYAQGLVMFKMIWLPLQLATTLLYISRDVL